MKDPASCHYPRAWRKDPVEFDPKVQRRLLRLRIDALDGLYTDLPTRPSNLLLTTTYPDAARPKSIPPLARLGDLVRLTVDDLMTWRNMGKKSVREIDTFLRRRYGLSLGMKA